MKTIDIRKGEKLTIAAIAYSSASGDRDPCPTLKFFQEQKDRDPDEFANLLALLNATAKEGPPQNTTKFKHLSGSDGLYEFKTGGGLRLFCFWDEGKLIVCTHGFLKKSQKTPKAEITRADKMMREYFSEKSKRK